MVLRDQIVEYINDYLQVQNFRDFSPLGLQVEGKQEVGKIVTSVSASVQLFEQAVQKNADMIIVHHGILWDNQSCVVKGGFKKRLELLIKNDITLLGYHLPLDKHHEIGNNAIAAHFFKIKDTREFAEVGLWGNIKPCSFDVLLKNVHDLYLSDPLVFPFGPERIEKIAVCSGSAKHYLGEAIDNGIDAFITGEAGETSMHEAKEGNIHYIAAGHYATERVGIKALGDQLEKKFDLAVEFIDIPNPV